MSEHLAGVRQFPTEDPRLGWVSKHDRRSLNYPVRRRLGEVAVRPKKWTPGVTLDQGREGACVGFGWTQEFLTSPRPAKVSADRANPFAAAYYRECLVNDEYPGEADEGTSVLAGAQTAVRRGMIEGYDWCLSVEDIRDAVIELGPVVIGIPWYEGMYRTRPSGLVEVTGNIVGGHCILVDEYHPGKRLRGEDYSKRYEGFGWHNSWGDEYGVGGRGFIELEDLRDLLASWGEACVPIGRKQVKL